MSDYISLGKASHMDKPQINGSGISHSAHRGDYKIIRQMVWMDSVIFWGGGYNA